MRRYERLIPMLIAVAALLGYSSAAFAQPVTSWSPTPTLENLQSGLLEMMDHLKLTHAQHEQVERIVANETIQLALTRGNPDLSVAKIFSHEEAIRMQARKQIESILTPRQMQKIAKRMIHEMEEDERWGEDPTEFFSIPAAY